MAFDGITEAGSSVTLAELRANELKRCFKCNLVKPFAEFSKDKTRADGLQPKCKDCHTAYRAANADRIAAQKAGMAPGIAERYPSGTIVCDACSEEKPLSEFQEYIIPRNTFRPSCNSCYEQYRAEWELMDTQRKIQWRLDNPEWCRKYEAEWAAKNPDKVAAKNKKFKQIHKVEIAVASAAKRQANVDEIRAHERVKYALNRVLIRARKRAWDKAHPEERRAKGQKRRARVRGATGVFTAKDVRFLVKVQGNKCAHSWCRKSLKSGRHIDHIMPLLLGGSNDRRNIQLLCPACNIQKNAKHPIDFAQQNGMLL